MNARVHLAKRLQGKRLRTGFGAAIVLLSLTFLAYFIHRNWAALTAFHWQLNYGQLILTVVFHLCAVVIALSGWHSIINKLGQAGDRLLNARIYCYSAMAARLPGVAWEIATRAVLYSQAGVSKAVVGLASLLELGLIVLSGIILYIALVPFTVPYANLGSLPFVIALAFGLVLSNPRLVTLVVRSFRNDAAVVSLTYRDTVAWLLIYLPVWVMGGLVLYSTVATIYDLELKYALQVIADWTISGVLMLFLTFVPSSLGLKEVTLTLLLSRYLPEHVAVAAAILARLLTTAYSIVWMLGSTRLSNLAERAQGMKPASNS